MTAPHAKPRVADRCRRVVWLLVVLLPAACNPGVTARPPVALYATAAAQPPPSAGATGPLALTATPTAGVMPTAAPEATGFDPAALAAQMLTLINRDRAAAGHQPVAWDETAAAAAASHAADMLARNYFSHWNPEGLGPDHRYTQVGGQHAAQENLYVTVHAFADGRGAPIDDWAALVAQAQSDLMNSPGHRANILFPAHSHVGIGLAYDPQTGYVYVAQEFVNQFVQLSAPLPTEARLGETVRLAGAFGPAAVGNGILELAYEPWPAPLSAEELATRSTYTSPAQTVTTQAVALTFDELVVLPASPPGIYHLRLYVDLAGGQALVVDHLISVR